MDIVQCLRRFGGPNLRELAGETLLRAVEACAPTNMEKDLSEVIVMRYGTGILGLKSVRQMLIDTLSEAEALELTRACGLSGTSHIDRCLKLQSYFTSYSVEKSSQLVSFLQLPSQYELSNVRDLRESTETISGNRGMTVELKGYLHEYQKQLKDEIMVCLRKQGTRFLVQMPTGAGKTFTALEALVDAFRSPNHNKFVVWLVDSNELAEQALDSFRFLWTVKGDRTLTLSRFYGSFLPNFPSLTEGGMVFASFDKFHSALSNSEHAGHDSLRHLIRNTDILVVDEAHASVARTYRDCIDAFIFTDHTSIFGLTATPGRANPLETEELADVFSKNLITLRDRSGSVVEDPIRFLQQGKFLAELNGELLETGVSINDSTEEIICKRLAADPERNKRILDQIELAHKARESTVVFACSLDHVYALKVLAKTREIPCELIVGATPQSDRLGILQRFKNREFFILINLEILSTGIDIPKMQKLLITKPIGSPILYSQIIGRALRGPKNGGNEVNTVVNLKDNLFNFPSANLLYTYFWEDWAKV
jgi:superfamily II DNA or RNA helicase